MTWCGNHGHLQRVPRHPPLAGSRSGSGSYTFYVGGVLLVYVLAGNAHSKTDSKRRKADETVRHQYTDKRMPHSLPICALSLTLAHIGSDARNNPRLVTSLPCPLPADGPVLDSGHPAYSTTGQSIVNPVDASIPSSLVIDIRLSVHPFDKSLSLFCFRSFTQTHTHFQGGVLS